MNREIKTLRSNSKEFKELIKYNPKLKLDVEGQAYKFLSDGIKKHLSVCKVDKTKDIMGKYINLVYSNFPDRMIKSSIEIIKNQTIAQLILRIKQT